MKKQKSKYQKISPKFDKWVLFFAIASIVIVISIIATDHLPAWSPAWGTIFETANSFAISFLVTTIFYIFTVFIPEKKKYEQMSRYIQIDKKRLDAEINRYSFFLAAHANMHLPNNQIDISNITQQSIEQAFEVFRNIDKKEIVWDNLAQYINGMILQLEVFAEKYGDYLSDEMLENIRMFSDTATFSLAKNASNWKQLMHNKTIFTQYYPVAVKFVDCTNLMKNSKPRRQNNKG